jgi:phosphoribosylanthranilate isomerase
MTMVRRPRVKVCCIMTPAEAAVAIRAGAAAIGLVSAMPSGPGVVPEATIAKIADGTPPGVSTFLLTSETSVEAIVAQQRRCRTNTVQLCDHLSKDVHKELRAALPGIRIVQVVHVTDESSVRYAIEAARSADALLLDSGNLSLPTKELGGTGRVHDWKLSRRIRSSAGVPVFLAGGLSSSNVGDAIAAVEPFGLDLCGGVRTDGKLDEGKVTDFFEAVARATGG